MFLGHGQRRRAIWIGVALVTMGIGCGRPPAGARAPEGPARLAILEADYGASPDHANARVPGSSVEPITLALADGGEFELDSAGAVGPVILVWIGGAEHEALIAWARGLAASLAGFDERGATLVFVRPFERDAALRWAEELRIQTTVVADAEGALADLLDLPERDDPGESTLEFAVLIIADQRLVYRKLGGRRPALDELLAVVEGRGATLRCCPGICVGSPCE